jgi:hypothetical protein
VLANSEIFVNLNRLAQGWDLYSITAQHIYRRA